MFLHALNSSQHTVKDAKSMSSHKMLLIMGILFSLLVDQLTIVETSPVVEGGKHSKSDKSRTSPSKTQSELGVVESPDYFIFSSDVDIKCNFSKHGIYLHFDKCYDVVRITNILGSHTISCENIHNLIIYGLTHFNSGPCSEIVLMNEFCHNTSFDGNPFLIPCRGRIRWDTCVIVSALTISLTLLVIYVRWLSITKFHTCINGTSESLIWNNSVITIKLKKPIEKVIYLKNENKCKISDEFHYDRSYEKFNILRLILLFFFIHRPINAHAIENATEIINYQLSSNSSITIGDFHLHIHNTFHYYPLTKIYYTGQWWYDWTTNVDCRFSTCAPYGTCPNGGTYGLAKLVKYTNRDIYDQNSHIELRNCRWGNSGCWFSSGCDNALVRIWWNDNNRKEVFQLEEGYINPHISLIESDTCKLISIRSLASTNKDDVSVVRSNTNVWYLGPKASARDEPEAFKIGDLQLDVDGHVLIHPELITFSHSSGSGWSFDSKSSGFKRQFKSYSSLPSHYKGDLYSIENGYLKRYLNSPVDISVLCKKTKIKSELLETCGGLIYKVTGIVGANTSVFLTVSTKFFVNNVSWEGEIGCIDKHIQIPCDSKGFLIKIPWPNNCVLKLNLSSINVKEQTKFTDVQGTHLMNLGENRFEASFGDNLFNLAKQWFIALPFGSCVILCLVLLLLLRK